MVTRIQRWGDSLAIRIPKSITDVMEITPNEQVDLDLRDGTLTVRRLRRRSTELNELLDWVSHDAVPDAADWGKSTEREPSQ